MEITAGYVGSERQVIPLGLMSARCSRTFVSRSVTAIRGAFAAGGVTRMSRFTHSSNCTSYAISSPLTDIERITIPASRPAMR